MPRSPASRRVIVIVFDGVQTLDATGPAEVFAVASREAGAAHYRVVVASVGGGERTTSSGLGLRTRDLRAIRPRANDLVVVAGGGDAPVVAAVRDRRLRAWLARAAPIVERVTSVCSGAFILAAAGLLDGKRATTHWSACAELARRFPAVTVDGNAIFVRDGAVWTSAGVTTGIDMALAIVEADHGRALADRVAAQLVLYVRRPGFQSQWSDALVAQRAAGDPLGPAIAWARGNLKRVDVDGLARHAGMSVRTLHRRCLAQLGVTPAALIDKLRVEHARSLLAAGDIAAKSLAAACGFGSSTRMNRAFARQLGLAPRAFRVLHGAGHAAK
ncbi:MAG TPA: DJ-1/PfpI family protein [Kofleriaceae bacterium]|nr:DJ-1/PfpI family protein [Kofleriaceae bacterium]